MASKDNALKPFPKHTQPPEVYSGVMVAQEAALHCCSKMLRFKEHRLFRGVVSSSQWRGRLNPLPTFSKVQFATPHDTRRHTQWGQAVPSRWSQQPRQCARGSTLLCGSIWYIPSRPSPPPEVGEVEEYHIMRNPFPMGLGRGRDSWQPWTHNWNQCPKDRKLHMGGTRCISGKCWGIGNFETSHVNLLP